MGRQWVLVLIVALKAAGACESAAIPNDTAGTLDEAGSSAAMVPAPARESDVRMDDPGAMDALGGLDAGDMTAAAAGSSGKGSPPADAGMIAETPSATFTGLFEKTFISCRMLDCHGSGWGGIDMSSQRAAYDSMVGQPAAADGPCADMTWVRVSPGAPDVRLIVVKLAVSPPCGLSMPPGAPLSADEQEQIRRWVEAGALDN